jgi:phage-related protein
VARNITINLEGDSSDLEQALGSASSSVDKFENNLKSADGAASKFDSALDSTTGKLGSTTNGMRSTADLAGGLGDVLGVSALGPIAGYATGMADIADGLGGLLAPALTKAKAAFLAMNTTLLANPIFLVIAALVALTAAFVIAYKKSETFREIVHAAMDGVKKVVSAAINFIVDLFMNFTGPGLLIKHFDKIKGAAIAMADTIKGAFNGIAGAVRAAIDLMRSAWNSTIGGKGIPSIGFGPFKTPGFSIPMLAGGGTAFGGMPHIVGERGPELFVPRMTGTVVPNNKLGGGQPVVIEIRTGSGDLDELIRKRVRVVGGGNVQLAFGR